MCENINFAGGWVSEGTLHRLTDLSFVFFFDFGLDLDMVVRDENGNIVDINQTSTTQLYEHHVRATNRIRRATVSD